MIRYITIFFILLATSGCGSTNSNKDDEKPKKIESYSLTQHYGSIGKIVTYEENRRLESEICFFVSDSIILARFSPFAQATEAKLTINGDRKEYKIRNYLRADRTSDLIALHIEKVSRSPIPFAEERSIKGDTLFTIGKKIGHRISVKRGRRLATENVSGEILNGISNKITKTQQGSPVFNNKGFAIGLGVQKSREMVRESFTIPLSKIDKILSGIENESPKPIRELSKVSSEESRKNSKIKKVVLKTDQGDITIKLYNYMPRYRDNFIKLAKEHYYDSLLIHRVIGDFVIQTGAADTRYSEPGGRVGWKGPGYTLPANINDRKFHIRGVIGSPRLGDIRNEHKRSNGSQFYIVTGRKYNDSELDQIEKDNNYKFSQTQRNSYKTVGGAPTLDGAYTIFGEVTAGISVADKINSVEVDNDYRPISDIRVISVVVVE